MEDVYLGNIVAVGDASLISGSRAEILCGLEFSLFLRALL